jgi:hypothetical protein
MIRKDVGDFAGTSLLKCPSKYAARLAQAFTATDPSVRISRTQWEEVDDLIVPGHEEDEKLHSKYVYTDGVGTIARKLGDMIWKALCESRHNSGANPIQPSAYQIRFLGYKGVVSVDEELDKHPDGILMRLRPSMKKFESDDIKKEEAEIEVAMAFEKPNTAYLNRYARRPVQLCVLTLEQTFGYGFGRQGSTPDCLPQTTGWRSCCRSDDRRFNFPVPSRTKRAFSWQHLPLVIPPSKAGRIGSGFAGKTSNPWCRQ